MSTRIDKGRRSIAIAMAVAFAMLASSCTTFFDYHRINIVDAQENGFFEDGDEVILATVSFRSTPGVAGSTQVWFNNGSLDQVVNGVEDGDIRTISNDRGLYTFDNVEFVGLPKIAQGQAPELMGQLVVAIENDFTPRSLIKDIMEDVRDELAVQLAAIIEPLNVLAVLADPSALAAEFSDAAAAVEDAASPGLLDTILIGLASLGNPDDLIDFNFVFAVPVMPPLNTLVDNAFADLPAGITGGSFPIALDANNVVIPKSFVLTFQGDGAHYDVTTYIGGGAAGYVPPPTPPPPPPWDPCFPNIGTPPPPPLPQCP